jgi:hypothetical protein
MRREYRGLHSSFKNYRENAKKNESYAFEELFGAFPRFRDFVVKSYLTPFFLRVLSIFIANHSRARELIK